MTSREISRLKRRVRDLERDRMFCRSLHWPSGERVLRATRRWDKAERRWSKVIWNGKACERPAAKHTLDIARDLLLSANAAHERALKKRKTYENG